MYIHETVDLCTKIVVLQDMKREIKTEVEYFEHIDVKQETYVTSDFVASVKTTKEMAARLENGSVSRN